MPTGIPARSLNVAIERFALVVTGFWPVMVARSRSADSSA